MSERLLLKKRIYELQRSITKKELASIVGISLWTLINIIFNPFYTVKLTQGIAIAKVFNVKASELLDIPNDIHSMRQS